MSLIDIEYVNDLIKREKQIRFLCAKQLQQALIQVKAALCGGPLLHSPNFLLQTGTLGKGLWYMLSQVVDGEECPILYNRT